MAPLPRPRTLITTVPQVDGSLREIHAQDAAHARIARELVLMDRAWIDALNGVEGIRIRVIDREVR